MKLTWPLDLIGVSQVFRCCYEHLCIGHRRPEGHHVKLSVVADGGVFQRIDGTITWTVSAQPFVEDGVSEGVQQHEYGVVGGEMCLSARPVQKQMSQVMQTAHGGVVVPLRGAVT